jgi:ABC-2 type transport system ATP-binding protein/lipopolysaccharide transport system ATP-binding protein
MTERAIEVDRVSKRYRLGRRTAHYETLRGALSSLASRSRQRGRPEFWALSEISVAVDHGESVALIGRNGAGKTTLLKILARISEPTLGVSRTRGRVGSLLEVGTGFHPELTGRDNVFLNGAILGMSRRDIARRFDEIVAFAGVDDFLDTPLKRYSAGMQLRLAFSVAAHLEPDIVLVDEVLAVGDAEFQQKCLARMADLRREGRTVVFVSHDLGAVRRLCPRSVWLDAGEIRVDGPTHDVVARYLAENAQRGPAVRPPNRPGQAVEVEWVGVTDDHGTPGEPRCDEPFVVRAQMGLHEPVPDLDVAIYLINGEGVRVINEAWHETVGDDALGQSLTRLEASVVVPPVLAPGEYVVGLWVASAEQCFFFEEVLSFRLRERADDLQVSIDKDRVVRSATGLQLRRLENHATR